MKVLAPLSRIENYEPLAEAGADEFFAGFISYEWVKKYHAVFPINRREYMFGDFHLVSLNAMKELRKKVDKYGSNIKITLNGHYYLPEQLELVAETIKMLMDIGYDTFIISDLALLIYLREKNINCIIHLSGEMQILNEHTAKFLDQFDFTRIIFPRLATMEDMKNTIDGSGLINKEYEAFIMNSFCPMDGGLCNGIHCEEIPKLCWVKAQCRSFGDSPKAFLQEYNSLPKHPQPMQLVDAGITGPGREGCGLCAIRKLGNIGITNLKIVGRGENLDGLIRDVKTVKEIVTLSKQTKDNEKFVENVLDKYYNGDCSGRLCYYPNEKAQLLHKSQKSILSKQGK
ncbi:U32 family peptidase [Parasporobacterium paucivorans]|uniref:Peptidase family U32 n=1 Tax=Parasporobacterium paucivorans DSM 15970 TaxID=1122934 RepID=A0A1M6A796_9FIRM|nr:U32 family peptidase [Parasporobacterium paucivorans]SHI32326.1 Peptidase family U32 [Parasporobacterium paucivorans DSM 15970]